MKVLKIFLPAMLIVVLMISWFLLITSTFDTYSGYNDCIKEAEQSIENKLYEQAIEFYKDSLEYHSDEQVYVKIKETYDILYNEEHTAFFRNCYIQDMEEAAGKFPKNSLFWEKQVELYLEAENYSKAYSTVKKAENYGAVSEKLDEFQFKLKYMTQLDYKLYYDYQTALNGYITVFDGNFWTVINENGDVVRSSYSYIGLLNDDGKGLYVNDIDTRLLDSGEVTRARFDIDVEKAGYYEETSDLIPVLIDGEWRYMNSSGEVLPGGYEIAGSFYNHEAVAFDGKQWVKLDEEGKQTELENFEDIKLDLYGCHLQKGLILAKESGKYHLYNTSFEKISDFAADDIDICVNDQIAFQKNGKWGFVDKEGNILLEPQFTKAKSFSNGYAAVCNENGMWGFINSEYELVVDYAYLDAFYFNSQEKCLISQTENTVQLLGFRFE